MDDCEIVGLFFKRNENAINETQKKYGKSLCKIALNIGLSLPDCEETENDTYLAAWNSIPPHEPKTYLFPFLAKIMRQKSINRIKENSRLKRKAEFVLINDEIESIFCSSDDIGEQIDEKALTKAINDFLRSVSLEKRTVFIRRYWFMDSIGDISERLGMSKGKVKTLLFRLRNELKEYLLKEGIDL